jgi:phosphatidylethanolamine-binding protein (PEBP) family uncharacterized protein
MNRLILLTLLAAAVWTVRPCSAHPWHRHGDAGSPSQEEAAAPPPAPTGSRSPFQLTAAKPAPAAALDIGTAFAPFEKLEAITCRRDDRWFYVESSGIPDHPLMVGIRAWQQQVPLPQPYVGDNAWRIPLHPVPAAEPKTTKGRFLRGAIAVAVNGIPIFNPLNNRGEDALAIGELDDFGGHCGRADDYHYHVAPVHLEKQVGKGQPIAYALDGYPIYGFTEPDGSPVKGLDWMGGHEDAAGNYHYHATKTYPYLNGGFRGELTERDGQVDPQPRAQGLREALPPLRGARIVGFTTTAPATRRLTYEVNGRKAAVEYTFTPDGSATFTFTDTAGRSTTETYAPRTRGPGGRDVRPNGAAAARPPAVAKPRGLAVTSPAFGPGENLPTEFTCDGAGVSPPLQWQAGPVGTAGYAVVLRHEAPDRLKSYWVVHGIPAAVTALPKGSRSIGITGLNDKGRAEYDPMCSKGPGAKTYHVTVYAVSAQPVLPLGGATREAVLEAIAKTTLAEGTLTFTYERGGAR